MSNVEGNSLRHSTFRVRYSIFLFVRERRLGRKVKVRTMPRKIRRIAMWSGPRNISTALMRSWGNRPDTVVCDEPLYAHYLLKTGVAHPGADEVIHSQENDWR